jgi:hypothetical protein
MKIAVMHEDDLTILRKLARSNHRVAHLLACYETMFEHACDPSSNVLEFKSFDMIIHCPNCKTQHIDEPDPGECMECGHRINRHVSPTHPDVVKHGARVCSTTPPCDCTEFKPWTNPPHRKHRCHNCNTVFAVTATLKTNGVKELPQ